MNSGTQSLPRCVYDLQESELFTVLTVGSKIQNRHKSYSPSYGMLSVHKRKLAAEMSSNKCMNLGELTPGRFTERLESFLAGCFNSSQSNSRLSRRLSLSLSVGFRDCMDSEPEKAPTRKALRRPLI